MSHSFPKILGYFLSTLCMITIISEVFDENSATSRVFRNTARSAGNVVDEPQTNKFMQRGKQTAKFFSLYTNMDEIQRQNSDIVPPRQSNLTAHDLCDEPNICVPRFVEHEARFKASLQYRMIHCVVQKSMSTVMTGIMCYLNNRKRFVNVDEKKNMTEWEKASLCRRDNHKKTVRRVLNGNDTDETLRKGWSLSMITRNPVERFVSGYVDRCVRAAQGSNPCNGCDKNMTCFILTEYDRFMKQTKRRMLTNTFEDRHFYPQNWRCDLKNLQSKYEFIRYSSDPSKELMTDLFKIARRQGVPDDELQYIEDSLTMKRRTSHTTAYSPARQFYEKRLQQNPLLMEYVVKMFYHDFVILNYPFPDGF